VASFGIAHREWASRNGRLEDIDSPDERYEDVDKLMA
jgi:hypothetical protein